MPDLLITPKKSLLFLSGEGEIFYRPGSIAGVSGILQPRRMPMAAGSWYTYPVRYFQPDRFRLSYAYLYADLWLGIRETPFLTMFNQKQEIFLVTEKLLFCSLAARKDAFMLRVLPGSMRKAVCISSCLPDKHSPVCIATAGDPVEVKLVAEDEFLSVPIDSLIGWQGCPRPHSFCPKLRLRDLILPRLPKNLTMCFQGPGKVWIEAPGRPDKGRKRPAGCC